MEHEHDGKIYAADGGLSQLKQLLLSNLARIEDNTTQHGAIDADNRDPDVLPISNLMEGKEITKSSKPASTDKGEKPKHQRLNSAAIQNNDSYVSILQTNYISWYMLLVT